MGRKRPACGAVPRNSTDRPLSLEKQGFSRSIPASILFPKPGPPTIGDMTERQFATDVVQTLRAAGYEAIFAGGCVRDMLLGLEPDDFDVATSARPEEVRRLFRHTIAVGASFGVIEVLGPKPLKVQVATFRSEGPYSDGRHPDSVAFTTAREDALRRDFTINGMFFDPVENRIIDYVAGETDLKQSILRAIGEPSARFREDHLRMLRAVRFAARFGLTIEPITMSAIRQMAAQVVSVSGERIAEELRKLFVHPNRATGVELLMQSGLWPVLFPETPKLSATNAIDQLGASASITSGLASLLGELSAKQLDGIADRLRLSNVERSRLLFLAANRHALAQPDQLPLHVLKPLLAHADIGELLAVHRALSHSAGGDYCAARLAEWSLDVLDPPPLLTGDDLKTMELKPGPRFKIILDAVRSAQLDGIISTRDEAARLVESMRDQSS